MIRAARVLLLLAAAAASSPARAAPPERAMRLVFAENFDRDPTIGGRWLPMVRKGARFLDHDSQIYVDRTFAAADGSKPGVHPFSVRGGILRIRAARADPKRFGRPYVSGALTTEGLFSFRYGYAEIRMRMPAGRGLWPAFWLMRDGPTEPYGEIDVAEAVGQDTRSVFATVHAGPDWKRRTMFQVRTALPRGYDRGFHTYGVDWTEKAITFYVDGAVSGWMSTPAELKDVAMFPIVDLAVGGQAGAPDGATRFPAELAVDYIRVWRRPPVPAPATASPAKP